MLASSTMGDFDFSRSLLGFSQLVDIFLVKEGCFLDEEGVLLTYVLICVCYSLRKGEPKNKTKTAVLKGRALTVDSIESQPVKFFS